MTDHTQEQNLAEVVNNQITFQLRIFFIKESPTGTFVNRQIQDWQEHLSKSQLSCLCEVDWKAEMAINCSALFLPLDLAPPPLLPPLKVGFET